MTTPSLDKLREEFPELYSHICFECGNGWYDLLRHLSLEIVNHLKSHHNDDDDSFEEMFSINKVKEKFGGLRYYASGACGHIQDLMWEAEEKSLSICENCGKEGSLHDIGWIYVRCDECLKELQKKHE